MIVKNSRLTLPVLTLALTALLPFAAHAQDAPSAPTPPEHAAPGPKHGGGFINMDQEDFAKVDKMTPEQRRDYMKQKRDAFNKMSPDEQNALRAKRKAWSDSLTPEQKKEMMDRHKKLRADMKQANKDKYAKMTPAEKEQFDKKRAEHRAERKKEYDSLTPAQKEARKARHEEKLKDLPAGKRDAIEKHIEKREQEERGQ